MAPRRLFSGIQPTGALHLGNYFGAVRRWAALESAGEECLFCVADLHALASDPAELRARTLGMALDLLACGLGRDGGLFVQSHVPGHAELAWLLSPLASFGELSRMTQFKEKARDPRSASAALFTYPVLMAADILLYRATHVPVGEDQLQHLELARTLARRFNGRFGATFPEPEALLGPAPRVMSTADPARKMSKSAGERHHIGIFEDEQSFRAKLRAAVTGPGGQEELEPGAQNLLGLLEQVDAARAEALREAHARRALRYSELKDTVAETLLRALSPHRKRRARLTEGDARRALARGARRAARLAADTLAQARSRVGLLPP